jgi:DNA polymerase-3 subunit beta
MKFSVKQKDLLKCLSDVQSVVEKRNSIPILANIKLEAISSKIIITATDLDIVIEEKIEASVEQQGVLTIPAQRFFDIVRKLLDVDTLKFSSDEQTKQITIKAGRSIFKLSFIDAEQYPIIKQETDAVSFDIDSKVLFNLLNRTQFAMSREETRYYLNGIYFHVFEGSNGEKTLRTAATDGHRLARLEVNLPQGAEKMQGVIIPRKTVFEIKKLLDGIDKNVNIKVSENKISFAFDDIYLISKVIDGTFPDYEKAIPFDNKITAVLDTKNLLNAVDRVSAISEEKVRGIKFSFNNDKLSLSTKGNDADSAVEELEIEGDIPEFSIGFNSKYTYEMLSQFAKDKNKFYFNDSNSPTLIEEIGDSSAIYVLMPMRF